MLHHERRDMCFGAVVGPVGREVHDVSVTIGAHSVRVLLTGTPRTRLSLPVRNGIEAARAIRLA